MASNAQSPPLKPGDKIIGTDAQGNPVISRAPPTSGSGGATQLPSDNPLLVNQVTAALKAGYDPSAIVNAATQGTPLLPSQNRAVRDFVEQARQQTGGQVGFNVTPTSIQAVPQPAPQMMSFNTQYSFQSGNVTGGNVTRPVIQPAQSTRQTPNAFGVPNLLSPANLLTTTPISNMPGSFSGISVSPSQVVQVPITQTTQIRDQRLDERNASILQEITAEVKRVKSPAEKLANIEQNILNIAIPVQGIIESAPANIAMIGSGVAAGGEVLKGLLEAAPTLTKSALGLYSGAVIIEGAKEMQKPETSLQGTLDVATGVVGLGTIGLGELALAKGESILTSVGKVSPKFENFLESTGLVPRVSGKSDLFQVPFEGEAKFIGDLTRPTRTVGESIVKTESTTYPEFIGAKTSGAEVTDILGNPRTSFSFVTSIPFVIERTGFTPIEYSFPAGNKVSTTLIEPQRVTGQASLIADLTATPTVNKGLATGGIKTFQTATISTAEQLQAPTFGLGPQPEPRVPSLTRQDIFNEQAGVTARRIFDRASFELTQPLFAGSREAQIEAVSSSLVTGERPQTFGFIDENLLKLNPLSKARTEELESSLIPGRPGFRMLPDAFDYTPSKEVTTFGKGSFVQTSQTEGLTNLRLVDATKDLMSGEVKVTRRALTQKATVTGDLAEDVIAQKPIGTQNLFEQAVQQVRTKQPSTESLLVDVETATTPLGELGGKRVTSKTQFKDVGGVSSVIKVSTKPEFLEQFGEAPFEVSTGQFSTQPGKSTSRSQNIFQLEDKTKPELKPFDVLETPEQIAKAKRVEEQTLNDLINRRAESSKAVNFMLEDETRVMTEKTLQEELARQSEASFNRARQKFAAESKLNEVGFDVSKVIDEELTNQQATRIKPAAVQESKEQFNVDVLNKQIARFNKPYPLQEDLGKATYEFFNERPPVKELPLPKANPTRLERIGRQLSKQPEDFSKQFALLENAPSEAPTTKVNLTRLERIERMFKKQPEDFSKQFSFLEQESIETKREAPKLRNFLTEETIRPIKGQGNEPYIFAGDVKFEQESPSVVQASRTKNAPSLIKPTISVPEFESSYSPSRELPRVEPRLASRPIIPGRMQLQQPGKINYNTNSQIKGGTQNTTASVLDFRTVNISQKDTRQKNDTISQLKQSPNSILKQNQITQPTSLLKQNQAVDSILKQNQAVDQIQVNDSLLKQQLQLNQQSIFKVPTINITTYDGGKPVPPPPEPPGKQFKIKLPDIDTGKETGFDVFVRGKGKKVKGKFKPGEFMKVNKNPQTMIDAESLGEEKVLTSAKMTFFIKPTAGKASTPETSYKFDPTKVQVNKKGYFVQTRKSAISSAGEKEEIKRKPNFKFGGKSSQRLNFKLK